MNKSLFKKTIIFSFLIIFLYIFVSCNKKQYINVKLNIENGIEYIGKTEFKIEKGTNLKDKLNIPKKQNYKFKNWQVKNLNNFVDFDLNTNIENDIILTPLFLEKISIFIYLNENEIKELVFFKNQELNLKDFEKIQKQDYVLTGLFLDKKLERKLNFPVSLLNNTHLYPKFEKAFKLSFLYNNNIIEKNYYLNQSIDLNNIKNILKLDTDFIKVIDKSNNKPIAFPFIITKNTDLEIIKLKTSNINVVNNFKDFKNFFIKKQVGYKLDINEIISLFYKKGFSYGFYKDINYTLPFEFPYTFLENDINLYVKYEPKISLTVLYEKTLTITKDHNFSITMEDLDTINNQKQGYELVGFSKTENGSLIEFPYNVLNNTTLYPVYKKYLLVTFFESQYFDNDYPSILLKEDSLLSLNLLNNRLPEKQGYKFEGFYLDKEYTKKITLPYKIKIDKDIIIYSKFIKI